MKKFVRTLSIACVICVIASIFSVSAFASSSAVPRTVRIRNMWNSSYMTNDDGVGKYSASKVGEDCVWTIRQYNLTRFTIENWDGTYLRANGDGTVTSEPMATAADFSYQWTLTNTNYGQQWITSYAYPSKAINIENLTGSLQLTTYYDTWESAKWIIEDITDPEFATKTGNVIFQTPNESNYLFNGTVIGPTSTMQAFINGNMLYQIIDNGNYCYIKYNPVSNSSNGYFKASSSSTYTLDSTLDETDVNYRWNIQENTDGTVSVVSVAYPNMCISNNQSCSLVNQSVSSDNVKWNMHSANSLKIRITNNIHTFALTTKEYDRTQAMFKYIGTTTPTGSDVEWQVIYNNGKMYLKNILTGKYLKAHASDGIGDVSVTDYDAAYDYLFVWTPVNLRYPLGLQQNGTSNYLHPAYILGASEDTQNLNAVVGNQSIYTDSYLDFAVTGFAY